MLLTLIYTATCSLTIYRLQELVISRRVASRANSTSFFQEVCPTRVGLFIPQLLIFASQPSETVEDSSHPFYLQKTSAVPPLLRCSAHPLLLGVRGLRWAWNTVIMTAIEDDGLIVLNLALSDTVQSKRLSGI